MNLSRMMQKWDRASILQTLREEGREADVVVWEKWCKDGWNGLKGGNVVFTDGSAESQRMNEENEQFKLACIHREFGWLTIDVQLMPRSLFEDIVRLSKEGW